MLTLIFSQLFPNVVPFGQDVVFPRKVGRKLCLITNSYKITAVTTKLPPVTEAERLLGQHIVSVQGKFSHSMSLSTSLSSSSSWRHLTKCRSITSTITRSGISEETHRYASGDLWLALWTLPLAVDPAVLWRLLVRPPAALGLPVPGALVDYVEQVKGVLVLPVRGLGLTPLVAVLAGGVVPPTQLDAGPQTLHDGVVQWHRRAPGRGHDRPGADTDTDPTGQRSQADTQHGNEWPRGRLSRGGLSHARKSPTSSWRLRSTALGMDRGVGMEDNSTWGPSYDLMWRDWTIEGKSLEEVKTM